MPFVAGIFSPARVHAGQIAGAVKQAFKFLIAVQLRNQRLPGDFGFWTIQLARPAIQPVGEFVRKF